MCKLYIMRIIIIIVFFVVIECDKNKVSNSQTICSPLIPTTCFVHNNINCQYKWTHYGVKASIDSDILRPHTFTEWRGVYQCNLECRFRGKICRVNPHTVIARECYSKGTRSTFDANIIY